MSSVSFQGASAGATIPKQDGLFGIYYMLALRNLKWSGRCYFFDLYSGSGHNTITINGEDSVVDGSPITLLEALKKASGSAREDPRYRVGVVFNELDIERTGNELPLNVVKWKARNGIDGDHTKIQFPLKSGNSWETSIQYMNDTAHNTLVAVEEYMLREPFCRAVLTIDPNGPKDFPYEMVARMFTNANLRNKLTLVIHISATALKRVAGARAASEGTVKYADMPENISALLTMLDSEPRGWIREPEGPQQWTIIVLTAWEPKYGWGKMYHLLSSTRGKELVEELSTTKKQLEKKLYEQSLQTQPELNLGCPTKLEAYVELENLI